MGLRVFRQERLARVSHDDTLTGDGTVRDPLRVAVDLSSMGNWDTAYDLRITGVSGTGNSTLTLTRPDSTNLTTDLSHTHPVSDVTGVTGFSLVGKPNTGTGAATNIAIAANGVPARAGSGNLASMAAGENGVLRRLGAGNLGFGTLATDNLANGAVTFAKFQNVSGFTVLSRPTGFTGPASQLSVGTNSILARGTGDILSMSAGTNDVLRRDGSGNLGFGQLAAGNYGDATVALAKLAADVGTLTSVTSNSNGTSIRFQLGSTGIQICAHQVSLGSKTANGAGTFNNPYMTNEVSWTYPQAFSSLLAAGATPAISAGAGARRITIAYRFADTAEIRDLVATQISDNVATTSVTAHVWAIGFWSP